MDGIREKDSKSRDAPSERCDVRAFLCIYEPIAGALFLFFPLEVL